MFDILKFRGIFLLGALAVFGWGSVSWIMALLYEPSYPAAAPARYYSFERKEPLFKLERYEPLLSGKLFWGKRTVTHDEPRPFEFRSNLIVWGIIKGKGNRAVVGVDGSSLGNTWVVKVGDLVEGEQVTMIGDDYIKVTNSTGNGIVLLTD